MTPDQEKLYKKSLRQIDIFHKNVKVKMALNSALRNYHYLKTFFGKLALEQEKTIKLQNLNKDIDDYVKILKEELLDSFNKEEEPEQPQDLHSPDDRHSETDREEASRTFTDFIPDSVFREQFPDQTARLLTQKSHGCNQVDATRTIFENIYYRHFRGQQIIVRAGGGKTYVLGSLIKNLQATPDFYEDCLSPWPTLYVTKASVIEQTKGVLSEKFGIDVINDVIVVNYDALRSSLIGILIEVKTIIVEGDVKEVYVWKKGYRPRLIINDESQSLAREESLQSRVSNAIFDNEEDALWDTYIVDASATPASTVSQFKHFALSTRLDITIPGLGLMRVTPESWPRIARAIADPAKPEEHVQAAVKRFVDLFEPRIIRINNIRPRHKSINSVTGIKLFENVEEEYHKAVENFNKKANRIKDDDSLSEGQKEMALIAQFTIYRKAAENCKRFYLTDWAIQTWDKGFAPVIAFEFKQTGRNVVEQLITKHGWKRDDISIIWGGATEALTAKKKLALKIKNSEKMQDLLDELDIDTEAELGIYLDEVQQKTDEQLKFEKDNDLLTQKPKDRERERLKFQSQISKLCMFSFKAGGVGLSLHHEEEYSNARPRRVKYPPVYSEKALVQALGRCPRITSISDTFQDMVYFIGTIEQEVKTKVVQKLRCLNEVTRAREDWSDIIYKSVGVSIDKYKKVVEAVDDFENDENTDVGMFAEYKE